MNVSLQTLTSVCPRRQDVLSTVLTPWALMSVSVRWASEWTMTRNHAHVSTSLIGCWKCCKSEYYWHL